MLLYYTWDLISTCISPLHLLSCWFGHLFFLQNQFRSLPTARSQLWSALDLTPEAHTVRWRDISLLYFYSGSSSQLSHAQLITHKHTHSNILAWRAIISPAVYFKRTCSPQRNTHYNLAARKCRVASVGSLQGLRALREKARKTDGQMIYNTRLSVYIPHLSLSQCKAVFKQISSLHFCQLLHKGKNNTVYQKSWNGSVLSWRQTHLWPALAAVLSVFDPRLGQLTAIN